jgi:hypothetical protein
VPFRGFITAVTDTTRCPGSCARWQTNPRRTARGPGVLVGAVLVAAAATAAPMSAVAAASVTINAGM